jgi:ankyrin repeat protein
VFKNDLAGLKRVTEGFVTFYDKKKKVNLRDPFKRTALFYALYHKSFDMVEFLVANGCETLYFDLNGRTVIHYAVLLECDGKLL